jgi:hypothetical protein
MLSGDRAGCTPQFTGFVLTNDIWTTILAGHMDPAVTQLRPPPYLEALADYLKTQEPETWAWFDSTQAQSDYADSLRLDLLKQTYRLDAAAYPDLFLALEEAKSRLGLSIPVTLYQSQRNRELNAALFFLPGEAHIVFEGDVLRLLDPAELRSVLGHELAHYVLWSGSEQRFFMADRIMQAMAHESRAEPSHVECARLMRLYTEIFADRGALQVTGNPTAVVSGLIKMQTGLSQVDAASYVRQAEEVFARSKVRTEELSHPEAFIRARATMLWADNSEEMESEVTRMIEGAPILDKLDLVGQQRMTRLTRTWLQAYLQPDWFRTDAVRGHARLFFPEFEFETDEAAKIDLLAELQDAGNTIRDYFCYVMLDFSAVDPDLELEPLRAAFRLAGELGWDARLETMAVKELKLKKAEVKKLRSEVLAHEPDSETKEEVS